MGPDAVDESDSHQRVAVGEGTLAGGGEVLLSVQAIVSIPTVPERERVVSGVLSLNL